VTQRDKRALVVLAAALGVTAIVWIATREPAPGVVAPSLTPETAEKRLARVRHLAAQLPAKEAALKSAEAELAAREKGLIAADTAAQAQAQIIQIIRRLGRAQSPPVDVRGNEIGPVRPFADDYGEVFVTVQTDCRIEQLVNLLADVTAQPELIATTELRVGAASGPEKVVPVRLTVSGVVPRKLIPEKKGITQF
jgi:hypothetical protein